MVLKRKDLEFSLGSFLCLSGFLGFFVFVFFCLCFLRSINREARRGMESEEE